MFIQNPLLISKSQKPKFSKKVSSKIMLKPRKIFFFSLSQSLKSSLSSISYASAYQSSIDPASRDAFWRNHLQAVHWFKKPSTILDQSKPPFCRWFPDGTLNMSYNCIDRHLKTHSDFPAIYHESPLTNRSDVIT